MANNRQVDEERRRLLAPGGESGRLAEAMRLLEQPREARTRCSSCGGHGRFCTACKRHEGECRCDPATVEYHLCGACDGVGDTP